MKPTIYHITTIKKGLLAVMPKPVAGEWIEEEFTNISHLDIHLIVSLLEPPEAHEVGLQDEAQYCKQFNMSFTSFPIPDRGLPDSAREFARLAQRLHQAITTGTNTVIHCRAGIGRSGLLAAAILPCTGLSPEEAFTLISEKRGIQVPDTKEQRNWLIDNAETITRTDGGNPWA